MKAPKFTLNQTKTASEQTVTSSAPKFVLSKTPVSSKAQTPSAETQAMKQARLRNEAARKQTEAHAPGSKPAQSPLLAPLARAKGPAGAIPYAAGLQARQEKPEAITPKQTKPEQQATQARTPALLAPVMAKNAAKSPYVRAAGEKMAQNIRKEAVERQRLATLDVSALERETAALEAARKQQEEAFKRASAAQDAISIYDYPDDEAAYQAAFLAAGDKASAAYAELEEMDKAIAAKKKDIERAKAVQFADIPNRDDFEVYAAKGAAMRNNAVMPVKRSGEGAKVTLEVMEKLFPNTQGFSPTQSIYDKLTDQEADIYNYLLAKDAELGTNQATEYLRSMRDPMTARRGREQADLIKDAGIFRPAATALYGVGSGLERAMTGIAQNFSGTPSPASELQYGAGYVRDDLKDAGPKILGSSLGQLGFDAAAMAGNMAPAIAASAAFGPAAGAATTFASAGGDAYGEALAQGYDQGSARAYGVLAGASEAGLQYVLGGISALGGKVVNSEAIQSSLNNIKNAVLRIPAKYAVAAAGEATEEYLQEILTPVFRNLALGENNEFKPVTEEAAYAALLAALSVGIMEGPNIVHTDINTERPSVAPLNTEESRIAAETGVDTPAIENPVESVKNAPTEGTGELPKMTMADFIDTKSPVWRNVAFEDTDTKSQITKEVHRQMVDEGRVVAIQEETTRQVAQSYPDVRTKPRAEKNAILKPKIDALKKSLRQFLKGLLGTSFEFEVNGNVLEATLYGTGIREVMEKVTQEKASMLYHSAEIFRGAQYLYSTPDYNGDPNIYRWNYFYTPVQIGDEVVGVRIAVRDMVPSESGRMDSQIYNWGIKRDASLDGGGPGQRPNTTGVSSDAPGSMPLGGEGSRQSPLSPGASSGVSSMDSIPQTTQDVNPEGGDGMPNSVGAAAARFAYQEAPTQSVSDRLFTNQQRRENTGLRTDQHKVYTDAEANADARERLAFDYEGEKASLETMAWGAAEEKMAHMILEDLVSDAVRTGDYAEVIRWKKLYDQKGGTEVGQALHARREYADSAPHVIARAAEFLESDKVKKLTDKKRAAILKNVTDQAAALEGLAGGDTAGVIDLIKRNSEIRRTTGLFSKKTAKTLSWALDAVAKLDGGYQYLKDIATAQVNNIATDYAGMGWATWVKNIRVTRLLSKVSTVMRNIGGNQLFDLAESMSTDLGVVADMLMSTASGRRTTAMDKSWFSAAKRNGSFEGALKSYVAVALDADLDADVRYEGTGGRTFKMTGNPLVRFLSTYAKFQSYALTTTDEFAKGGTRAETQRGIDALREAGKLGDETLDGWADEIAKQRTFQNDGKLAKVTLGMRNALNNISATDKYGGKFGAGDVAIPFARVPANLPARLADYTPLGLGKSLVQLVKACWDGKHGKLTAEHQAQVALNMGRGTTGTALLAAITFLGYMGAVRVAGDDDEDKEALEKAQRQNGTQWNLDASLRALSGESGEWRDGDTLMSVGWLEPLSGLLSIGALLGESIKEDGVSLKTAWDGTDATFSGMIQSVLDTPAMSWINDLQTAYKYSDGETDSEKFVDTAIDYVGGQVSGLLVPNAVRGIAQGTDNVVRNTYTSKNPFIRVVQQVQSGIPGLRQKLPAAVDGFGRERTYTDSDAANFLNSSILPGQVTTYHQTEVEKELERVSDATEDYRSTHNIGSIFPMKRQVSPLSFTDEDGVSHKVTLDAAQVAEYNRVRGTTHLVAVTEMMGNRHYKTADEETKAKLLQNCREYASLRARVEALTKTEDRDGYEVPSQYKKAQTAQRAGALADYYFYKLEQKKCSDEDLRSKLRGDKSLTPEQKGTLDKLLLSNTVIIKKDMNVDYSNEESFVITQMSEAAQKKWSRAQELGYTAQEYKTYYGIYAQQGKKKDEKLKELEAAGLSRREAKAFWKAMGEKD